MSGWLWLVAVVGGFLGAALYHAGKRLLAHRRGTDRNTFYGSDEEFLASLDAPRCDFDCYLCQGPNHPEPLDVEERLRRGD